MFAPRLSLRRGILSASRYGCAVRRAFFGGQGIEGSLIGAGAMLIDEADENHMPREKEASRAKVGHGHLNDLGLISFIAYFFCILTSASIRSSGLGTIVPDEGILIALLAFIGATCVMLLALAMAEPYMHRHDNHGRMAVLSGFLMVLGPAFCVVENLTGRRIPL